MLPVGLDDRPSPARRLITVALLALAIGLLAAIQYIYFYRGVIPGDAFVYLGAGERLNAGHLLYALSPGDRPIGIQPPDWMVPLVSPPPIAVVFRAFALLPGDSGAYAWWAVQLGCFATALIMLGRRVPLQLAIAMLILVIPTVYEIGVGNLNAILLLGLILVWRWAIHGHEGTAGATAAVMTAVKLTPAMMIWWLLATGHRRAVLSAVLAGMVVLGLSILGAGFDTHLEYLEILRDGSIGSRPLSLGGMAMYIGLPSAVARYLSTVAIGVGLVLVVIFRHRPGTAFGVAVITMIYGSPSVSINWYVLLYALLAPIAWPAPSRRYPM
jgi:hypothetical protein